MPPFQIKTYNPSIATTQHYFYVLCKGLNSGKPLSTPCPNCFIILAITAEEKEILYWLTYAMWKGRAFHPFLRGSVIPFITIHDYSRQLEEMYRTVQQSAGSLMQIVDLLKQLEEKEAQALQQIKLIAQVKQHIFRKFMSSAVR